MVFKNGYYCENCGKKYTNTDNKWCKPCQINYLQNNFTNWTSENKEIDDFIQEKQLKINKWYDIVFEWIPYNQFDNIKKTGKDDFDICLAMWKDGPLNYNQ